MRNFCANIGGDTDTIGAMATAISGLNTDIVILKTLDRDYRQTQ